MAMIVIRALALSPSSPPLSPPPLTVREAISGIFGSISLACWLFLLLPQLVENYRNGSADAISLGFVAIWFLGDVFNLVGAVWAGLVSTVVAVAVYFCIADGVLISQILYYHTVNMRREAAAAAAVAEGAAQEQEAAAARAAAVATTVGHGHEEAPLLTKSRSGSYSIPGSVDPSSSRRRYSSCSRRRYSSYGAEARSEQEPLLEALKETDESGGRLWVRNILSIVAIMAVGTAGWAVAYGTGAWKPAAELGSDPGSGAGTGVETATAAQVLGYISAVLYLGARLPQIYKNWKEQSCEGLSLLFFVLSLLGNLTYGVAILAHSTEREYVVKNTPWLIGSLGTMAEDVMIFVQFHRYQHESDEDEQEESAVS